MSDSNPNEKPRYENSVETPKTAAVENWQAAVEGISDPKLRIELSALDIHDRQDRMRIEEAIEHDVPEDDYLALHDAFDELQTHFEGVWK